MQKRLICTRWMIIFLISKKFDQVLDHESARQAGLLSCDPPAGPPSARSAQLALPSSRQTAERRALSLCCYMISQSTRQWCLHLHMARKVS